MYPPALQQALKLLSAGRLDEAAGHLTRFLKQNPDHPRALTAMTHIHAARGQGDEALACARRAVAAAPADADLRCNVAVLLSAAGDVNGAVEHFEAALAADPTHARALVGLTDSLYLLRRYSDAAARAEQGLRIHPGEPLLINNRAAALAQMGRARECVAALRGAAPAFPHDAMIAFSLAAFTNYVDGIDPSERLRLHQQHARLLLPAGTVPPPRRRASDPEKRLRIGILSNDLRRHAVGRFIGPFFALGDSFETWAYSTCLAEDAHSAQLRARAASWRRVRALSDAQLADQIRRDGVDILIETSGLTTDHRLGTMRLRPAPLQMTAIGYPATTGVPEIDYRLVDSITDPPGPADKHGTERLLRLDPCFLCHDARAADPGDLPPAAPRTGPIAFGSFNALSKLDDAAVRLWSAVLKAVPGSRLVLKTFALAEPPVREHTRRRFTAEGIDPARVEFLDPPPGFRDHLAAYAHLDIALDAYPYHGTTTTCEALFMGVPVVTLAGSVHASRVGASLLSAAGLGEWVAADEHDFVRIASALASDRARLNDLRSTLRERLLASTLCDADGYAERMAVALRALWRDACARA